MTNLDRKNVLSNIIQNINFSLDECKTWIRHFEEEFGYITMAHYIRVIESRNFDREEKNELLGLAIRKLNFSIYEGFFESCRNLDQLYQKIFMLIMIQHVFEYFHIQSYFVWMVIARYYIEEHHLLSKDDSICDYNPDTNKGKIFWFFKKKNIDLQEKFEYHQQKPNLFEFIVNYFKSHSNP
jgi:hypothetical protein